MIGGVISVREHPCIRWQGRWRTIRVFCRLFSSVRHRISSKMPHTDGDVFVVDCITLAEIILNLAGKRCQAAAAILR